MQKSTEQKQANRRRSLRASPRKSAKLECRKGSLGLGRNLTVRTIDVSDSGACLIITEPLSVMSKVEIIVDSYGLRKPIKRLATVRWQVKIEDGGFCTGVEFQKPIDYRDWQSVTMLH